MAPAAAAVDEGSNPSVRQPPEDVTIPPKEIRAVIEKSADFVLRRGKEYEDRMFKMAEAEHKFQFVFPDNIYHGFYLWRKEEIREGRGVADQDGIIPTAKKTRKGPIEPPAFEFSARMPTINPMDLEIVKLTALFVAVKGSAWLTKFSQTYGLQPQFQFLRPQANLHQYFTRMIDQYRELLPAEGRDLAGRQKRRLEELDRNITDKYHILDNAKQRAEWVKYQETQKVQKEEAAEADKIAYAQIDWHDFAIVATIDFTDADERANLPEPQSLNDLQSQSLEEKAASMAPVGMRLEEAMPEDFGFFGGQTVPTAPYPPQPTAQIPHIPQFSPMPYSPAPPSQASPSPMPYIPAQAASAEDAARIAERQNEADRAASARAAAAGSGPMRIRDNYVPRAQARRANPTTVLCSLCNQQIPADEYSEHVRIEQLDPRWREQTRINQQRSSTTNLSTVDVANNLKRLASQRSDVFDPVTGREIAPDARETKRQETQMPAPGSIGAPTQRPTDTQEQIKLIQSKYGTQNQQQR